VEYTLQEWGGSSVPSSMALRSTKYDRQLRIWGEHGQSALERAHICVLNCGPTGSEALKNLVLGGIGSFTVVDASKVCASDLGNNYFGMLLFLPDVSSLA
jgi:amyloid beta precursor protein binding protein 1